MIIGVSGSPVPGGLPSTPPSPASFTWNTGSTVPPSTLITFTDTSPNTPTNWSWKINGSEFSIDQVSAYLFTTVGDYGIQLTATNFFGDGIVVHTIHVTGGGGGA